LIFQVKDTFNLPFYWDTSAFLTSTAKDIARGKSMFSYMVKGTDYPHTFLLPFLLSLIFRFTDQTIFYTHLFSTICSFSFLITIYYLSRQFIDKYSSKLLILLFLFNPLFIAQTGIVYFEIIATALRLITIYFLFKKKYYLVLVFSLLAFLTRFENGPILIIAFLAYGLLYKNKKIITPLISLITINIFWFFYHKIATGWWFYSPLRYFEEDSIETARRMIHYLFISQGRYIASIILGLGFLFFLIRKKTIKKEITKKWSILLVATLPTVLIIIKLGYFLPRYLIPILPIYYLAIFFFINKSIKKKRVIILSTILTILIIFTQNQKKYDCYSSNLEDCFSLFRLLDAKKEASQFIEKNYSQKPIILDFPEDSELTSPSFGFITHKLPTVNFKEVNLNQLQSNQLIYITPTSSHELSSFIEKKYLLIKEIPITNAPSIKIYRAH
jgi:hypothetical protein